MLDVAHVIEEQFPVSHVAIVEGAGSDGPSLGHCGHYRVQFFSAVLQVGEQFVFGVGALRRDAVSEFGISRRLKALAWKGRAQALTHPTPEFLG